MIRDANISDLPRIVEMGRHFLGTSTYAKHLGENTSKMAELAEKLIKSGNLLVSGNGAVTGMLGYIIHSHFMSGETVAGERFWWVEPDHRGDGVGLLRETEKRSKQAGARYIQMIAPNEKVAQFYGKLGYEFVEATYQKKLDE